MSSSGSVEVVPAGPPCSPKWSTDPGASPVPVGGDIRGVALPAAGPGDAPAPSLLPPALLVRLYRVAVGVVPAPPEDVNTSERL